jgi:hypothetical protein
MGVAPACRPSKIVYRIPTKTRTFSYDPGWMRLRLGQFRWDTCRDS